MLDANFFKLAHIIHEERVAEALQKQQHRPLREPQVGWLPRLLLALGTRMIDLGLKLETQVTATSTAS